MLILGVDFLLEGSGGLGVPPTVARISSRLLGLIGPVIATGAGVDTALDRANWSFPAVMAAPTVINWAKASSAKSQHATRKVGLGTGLAPKAPIAGC